MSWLSGWLKKGLHFKITLPWWGEKNLPDKVIYPKTVTKKECEQEIRESLKKKGVSNGMDSKN